jgi:hypothetical protein
MSNKIKDNDNTIVIEIKNIQDKIDKAMNEIDGVKNRIESDAIYYCKALNKQNEILERLIDAIETGFDKILDDTDIRPCVYIADKNERSVIFHGFNNDGKAIIKFLDTEYFLKNGVHHVNGARELKRYFSNEECFKKEYDLLKKEYVKLFKEDE